MSKLEKIVDLLALYGAKRTAEAGDIRQDTPATAASTTQNQAAQPVNHTSGQRIVKTGGVK